MEKKKIYRSELTKLDNEIKALTPDVPQGSESAAVLSDLLVDLHEILIHPGDVPFSHHRTLVEKLEDAEQRFAISHPNLTATMRSVIGALNSVGI